MAPVKPVLCLAACLLCLCRADFNPSAYTLPPGFSISLYQGGLMNARGLARSEAARKQVIIYVGSKGFSNPPAEGTKDDKVWAVVDLEGDGKADYAFPVLSGFANPNGVAWRGGSLYVGLPTKILRLPNIDQYALQRKPYNETDIVVVTDVLPPDTWHGTKTLRFGPDGRLYFGIGTPCDVCIPGTYPTGPTSQPRFKYGSLYRMNVNGTNFEVYATGLRNTVGFDWHPKSDKLYFTDNGANAMGNNEPDDVLQYAPKRWMNFGFPYCHTTGKGGIDVSPAQRKPGIGKGLPDPLYNEGQKVLACSGKNLKYHQAIQALGPHVAALGMRVYTWSLGKSFPQSYDGSIFIAVHGSSGRDIKLGYNVMRVTLSPSGANSVSYQPFVTGWLQNQGSPNATVTGRPVDVLQLRDGSLLISDDFAGAVYRVKYTKPKKPT